MAFLCFLLFVILGLLVYLFMPGPEPGQDTPGLFQDHTPDTKAEWEGGGGPDIKEGATLHPAPRPNVFFTPGADEIASATARPSCGWLDLLAQFCPESSEGHLHAVDDHAGHGGCSAHDGVSRLPQNLRITPAEVTPLQRETCCAQGYPSFCATPTTKAPMIIHDKHLGLTCQHCGWVSVTAIFKILAHAADEVLHQRQDRGGRGAPKALPSTSKHVTAICRTLSGPSTSHMWCRCRFLAPHRRSSRPLVYIVYITSDFFSSGVSLLPRKRLAPRHKVYVKHHPYDCTEGFQSAVACTSAACLTARQVMVAGRRSGLMSTSATAATSSRSPARRRYLES